MARTPSRTPNSATTVTRASSKNNERGRPPPSQAPPDQPLVIRVTPTVAKPMLEATRPSSWAPAYFQLQR